jgi:hypothetical protein
VEPPQRNSDRPDALKLTKIPRLNPGPSGPAASPTTPPSPHSP